VHSCCLEPYCSQYSILITVLVGITTPCCFPPPSQGLASRALAGRLQAGLEAYNRHATEEMDSLLEVQRNLMARERQLQGVVSALSELEDELVDGLVWMNLSMNLRVNLWMNLWMSLWMNLWMNLRMRSGVCAVWAVGL
jgi:hypothetical protein